jgi:predicted PhzF superfamily epimerase YddE/YHI9
VRILQIDSFTDQHFRGNPAGVVLLDEPRDADWMQSVAAEMNLPETAFLEATADPAAYGLRWFSPTVEVELCGHATLAAAHALWQSGAEAPRLRFATRSGELTADRSGNEIVLDFPVDPPTEVERATAERVVQAVGSAARWVGRGKDKFLVQLESETAVRTVDPDLAAVLGLDAMGVIVTAAADPTTPPAPGHSAPADFVSRFFAPAVGIDEDPVTGAAHCCLAPFWADRLGRQPLTGYQASVRGGFVGVDIVGDRVRLSGRAVTVLHGQLA